MSACGETMSSCCDVAKARKAPPWMRRVREVLAWIVPGTLLALMPKCPACLAAYVALWTGLGLSFSTAAYLRWAMLIVCVASLLFLMIRNAGRLRRLISHFQKRTERCNVK